MISGESEKLQTRPAEFSMDAFVSFNEVTNLSKNLLRQLTGTESTDYTNEEIKGTRNCRLEKAKKLSERELTFYFFYENPVPLPIMSFDLQLVCSVQVQALSLS